MSFTGMIYNIQHFAVHDGPGIRTTVFFKGCPLDCWWCHNPESRSFKPISMNGKTIGTTWKIPELLKEIVKDRVFYDDSGGGVTYSGGEPMSQINFLEPLMKQVQEAGIHQAIDTAGHVPTNYFERIVPYTDLFLFDLKLIDDEKHNKYIGESNQLIIDNLHFILKQDIKTIIRIPMIPGITMQEENLRNTVAFLKKCKLTSEVHLLPYHKTADHKYKVLGLKNKMIAYKEMTEEEKEYSIDLFKSHGFKVKLGG